MKNQNLTVKHNFVFSSARNDNLRWLYTYEMEYEIYEGLCEDFDLELECYED